MAIPEPRIASLHIGRIQAYTDADGTPWQSAIAKAEVPGPLRLGRLGPAGDAVADTVHHGGEHHAVMVYSRTHASYWKDRLGLDIGPGGLGRTSAWRAWRMKPSAWATPSGPGAPCSR